MLFEQRCYTLKPGATTAFWQAQVDRGFELVKPIGDRLIGYFSTLSGSADQVTHTCTATTALTTGKTGCMACMACRHWSPISQRRAH